MRVQWIIGFSRRGRENSVCNDRFLLTNFSGTINNNSPCDIVAIRVDTYINQGRLSYFIDGIVKTQSNAGLLKYALHNS